MTATTTTATDANAPRMYTRGDAMRILRIGETSLHWLIRQESCGPCALARVC